MEQIKVKEVYRNRKALWDYEILETFECGIVLKGTEIKSIRNNGLNIKDAWCAVEDGQLIIKQMHISEYEKGNRFNVTEDRERKLLAHKNQIRYMYAVVKKLGYTLVPISVYFKGSYVKVEVAVAKGRKKYDKRFLEAIRDSNREIERSLKNN